MKKIILIAILFCACSPKENNLKYLICKDSIQYWNYEWPRVRSEYYGFTFSFDKNGKVVKYSYDKEKNIRRLFTDGIDMSKEKWSISEDSIFKFMKDSEKIIKFNEDTIFAIDLLTKQKVYYVRVKGDLNIVPNPVFKARDKDSIDYKIIDI
ncbi:hypothetical protein ACX0HA_15025 [Flavobacterium hauense]